MSRSDETGDQTIPYCDAPTIPDLDSALSGININVSLQAGVELQGYRIVRVLSQGLTSVNYLAYDLAGGKQVVLKEFFPSEIIRREESGFIQLLDEIDKEVFEEGRKRFLAEACFLMSIEHPAIIKVFGCFIANETAYMVMSFSPGETLFQAINQQEQLSQQSILRILYPLLDGVSALHDKNCFHRDIKPSNIFLVDDEDPLLLDFGAALFDKFSSVNSIAAISQGYTPIEQYSMETDEQGAWTDIYALGATLYKSVVGASPIDSVERGQRILKDLEDPYQPLTKIAAENFSMRFLSAIDHALCFRPVDRPQSISQWREEFEGKSAVWNDARVVKQSLLHEFAKRSLDFDLYP